MSPNRRIQLRFLVIISILGITGLAATAYLLVQQRAPNPFQDVYEVKAQFTSADAIVGGLGQPVNVVGVKVGQVKKAELVDGRAVVTMEIERDKVPAVRRDATAALEPVTPLKDMQINLDPGRAPAPALAEGEMLGIGQTSPVVPLSDLLSVLDEDTRTFFGSMVASLDQGVSGRGPDLRKALRALGPTTRQAGQIAEAMAARRRELSRLVTNLARVTQAASRDRRLASLVASGNATLEAVAAQDDALRAGLRELPPTLAVTETTLAHLEPFAKELQPTLASVLPSVRKLPATLGTFGPFAEHARRSLREDVRPLVRDLNPLADEVAPVVRSLSGQTPHLTRSFQTLTYFVNELAYNPGGRNQGYLFWLSWALHNFNSVISLSDAHGGIGRAQVMANCYGTQEMEGLGDIFDLFKVCPK
ncbi:MlaD family protein [Paraconexibacter sp.]|uniref:MlaD family protein n=1 Tax=Paraconexibacter sp. TaxID=2949640 RepID=UPI0035667ED2